MIFLDSKKNLCLGEETKIESRFFKSSHVQAFDLVGRKALH